MFLMWQIEYLSRRTLKWAGKLVDPLYILIWDHLPMLSSYILIWDGRRSNWIVKLIIRIIFNSTIAIRILKRETVKRVFWCFHERSRCCNNFTLIGFFIFLCFSEIGWNIKFFLFQLGLIELMFDLISLFSFLF